MRFACIGCGFIARRHLEHLVDMKGVSVRALADIDLQAAEAYQQEFGADYVTDSANRIFEDPNVDAVLICTRHDSHTPLSVEAAKAGKQILLEKPMALTVEECERIIGAVDNAGVTLAINYKFRFAPTVLEGKRQLGQPLLTVGQLAMDLTLNWTWAKDPVQGGGLLLGTACHVFDTAYWLNESEPVRVYAESVPTEPEDGCNVQAAVVTVRFANGAVASLSVSEAGETPHLGKWVFEVFDGTKAALFDNHFAQVWITDGDPEHLEWKGEAHSIGIAGILTDFVEAVETGRQPTVTGKDGLRATLLARRILASLQSGAPMDVTVPW